MGDEECERIVLSEVRTLMLIHGLPQVGEAVWMNDDVRVSWNDSSSAAIVTYRKKPNIGMRISCWTRHSLIKRVTTYNKEQI
jgi:hypothetical protein